MNRNLAALLSLCLLVLGAALPIAAQVDTGSANFSNYVAIGDSLTGAIVSGGWVDDFQANSFPALIHRQATGGSGGFQQPLISNPGITPPLQLQSLAPVVLAPPPGLGQPTNLMLPRPYNNLGVPGARVGDTVRTVTDSGGPHDLVLRGLGTALQQAIVQQPTFATVWIGNNDALAAATSGIVIDGFTLTPTAQFEADYRTIIGALASNGVQMAVATIPLVTSIPFVTTVPGVVVNPATSQPVIGPDGNPIPLIGPNGPVGADDNVLLSASAELARGFGIPRFLGGNGQPLSNGAVLDATETATINARVGEYNSVIRTVAGEVGAVVVESGPLLAEFASVGREIGGITYSANFLTGGLFSYDGVHPSPFGYAFIANEFIKAINEAFDASIPQVSLAPFIFGEFTLASPVGVTAAQAAQAQLTPEALANLKWLLTSPGGFSGTGKPGDRPAPPDQGAEPPAPRGDEPTAAEPMAPRGRGSRAIE
jgi:lysophospholipase L1-like esterase